MQVAGPRRQRRESILVEAHYITPLVRSWLAHSQSIRVLHVFDRACNLVNSEEEIVSLVAAEIGPGPFAVVLPAGAPPFSRLITQATPVAVEGSVIKLGALAVDTAPAVDWSPRPAWEAWRRPAAVLDAYLPVFKTPVQSGQSADSDVAVAYQRRFAAGTECLLSGLATGNAESCRQGAQQLAGLGPGLTPAGDDFLIGAVYGLWATRPAEAAQSWRNLIVETAAPRTTLLSAAWLHAAGRGEAGEAWHELMRASGQWTVNSKQWAVNSKQCKRQGIVAAVERILNTGHTSGADALAGFIAVLEVGI